MSPEPSGSGPSGVLERGNAAWWFREFETMCEVRDREVAEHRAVIRRFANSWGVVYAPDGVYWTKLGRRERMTPTEEATYRSVCAEEGVEWPM